MGKRRVGRRSCSVLHYAWISLLDGLKLKLKEREDRISNASEDTERSRRIQENLDRRWSHKERSPAIETGESIDQLANEDLQVLSANLSSASQSLVHAESSASIYGQQTSTTAASSSRPAQRRTRQQPVPPQPPTEIAARISSLAAELKAGRAMPVQAVREEFLRLEAKVTEFQESVEARLAKSDQKTSLVLNILLRMEQQQNKDREKENV